MGKMLFCVKVVIFIALLTVNGFCNEYWVDAENGNDAYQGTSSNNAWQTITHAISQLTEPLPEQVIIHVASGTYDLALGETFPLVMKSNIQLIGEDREMTILNATGSGTSVILCDNIVSVDIKGLTIEGGSGILTDIFYLNHPCGGGIYCLTSDLRVLNCTITKNKTEDGIGGGIYCGDCSLVEIDDCIISYNKSFIGGGIYEGGSSPSTLTISESTIEYNTVERGSDTYPGCGGGISSWNDSSLSVIDCMIRGNKAHWGGGIYSSYLSSFKIKKTFFEDNSSEYCGGGFYCYRLDTAQNDSEIINCEFKANISNGRGGAIFCYSSSPKILGCNIENNSAKYDGGGIVCDGDWDSSPIIVDCEIKNNKSSMGGGISIYQCQPEIINCLISNSTAEKIEGEGGTGGGINIAEAEFATVAIVQTTIAGNKAEMGAGVFSEKINKPLNMMNCIVWENGPEPIVGPASISFSDIEGGFEGNNNIDKDPLFASGPWGDYYLSQKPARQVYDSPCLNKGSDFPEIFLGFNHSTMTTRTDGVLDYDGTDMGYYYQPHIQFDLEVVPDQKTFKIGDNLKVLCDIVTAPYKKDLITDLYFILLDGQTGDFFSYPSWKIGFYPAAESLSVPGNLSFDDIELFDISLPSDLPSIPGKGMYALGIFAKSSITQKAISGAGFVIFEVE